MATTCPNRYFLPYISDTLLSHLAASDQRNDTTLVGTLLLADLSGFTAMSEKLAGLGRYGGEKLTEIINACFDPLLQIVFAAGGDVIKFGGDAFLVFFPGENKAATAYQCATQLVKWVSEYGRVVTPVGQFTLGVHIGISAGQIYSLCLGVPGKRREHLFCGEAVEQTYAAADHAGLGQIAVSNAVREKLPFAKVQTQYDGYFVIANEPDSGHLKSMPGPIAARPQIAPSTQISDFIIDGLDQLLAAGEGKVDGEHRVLTTLFVGINSLRRNLDQNRQRATAAIEKYFALVSETISRHAGALARLDSTGNSEKMLIFFGAPKSTGKDAVNALNAILEIERVLEEVNQEFPLPIAHRYGVNTGLCFVGDVGGKARREYTAMGDAINLAARLMAKATPGRALVGHATRQATEDSFEFSAAGLFELKGKSGKIKAFYLERRLDQPMRSTSIIGREQELAIAGQFLEACAAGQPASVLVTGEPGSGKSVFVSRMSAMARQKGLHVVLATCFKQDEKSPYGLIKKIMAAVTQLPPDAAQSRRRRILTDALEALGEKEWEPLMAILFDYSVAIPPDLANLPDDIKKERIKQLSCRLISQMNQQNRLLLMIDDIQWIDVASLEIVELLIRSADAPGVVFVARPGEQSDRLREWPSVRTIELGPLSPESARQLFCRTLRTDIVDEKLINRVVEKSAGNPFFIEEMAKAINELGAESFDKEIPSGIESVITARIDNLGEAVKRALRTASVIGRVFAYRTLRAVFPDKNVKGRLRQFLEELSRLDLTPLERCQPVVEYIFKHILTQEVAYNGLPYTIRRDIHRRVAEYYLTKKRVVKHNPELIARHFLAAGEHSRALPFLLMAARKATACFANAEAFDHYEKALDAANRVGDQQAVMVILRERGELAEKTGKFGMAKADFLQLKAMAPDHDTQVVALKNLAEVCTLSADYATAENSLAELQATGQGHGEIEVFCLNSRAVIYRRQGELNRSLEHLRKALDIAEKSTLSADLAATVLNNMGICLWSLGRLQEALACYKRALCHYRHMKDLLGQAKVTNNMGIISEKLGNLRHAAVAYSRAEKIFKRIGASRSQAYAAANLGTNLTKRAWLAEALAKLWEAHGVFEQIGDRRSAAYAEGDLACIYQMLGEYERAQALFTQAIEKGEDLGEGEFVLENKIRLAEMHLWQSGQLSGEKLVELQNQAEEVGSPELKMKSFLLQATRSVLNRDLSGLEKALSAIRAFSELTDFPEIHLQTTAFLAIDDWDHGRISRAKKGLLAALRKALRKDFATTAMGMWIFACGVGLAHGLPQELHAHVTGLLERACAGFDPNQRAAIQAEMRRRIARIAAGPATVTAQTQLIKV